MNKSVVIWLISACFALGAPAVRADSLTPNTLGGPVAVQPFSGLEITGGVSQSFFSDLSALSFPGPGFVDILGNIEAFDSSGNEINDFQITGVTVSQGASTLTPDLETFPVTSSITYSSTLDPSNQVTLTPGALNLGFTFNSDLSLQYSYAVTTTGIPDGGFLLYDDVEGSLVESSQVPEPSNCLPVAVLLVLPVILRYRWTKRLQLPVLTRWG